MQLQSFFDRLLNKYSKQKANSMNRPIKKVQSPPKQVYMPKKEVPAAPLEGIKQKYLIIGPMKVLIEEIKESSVIENRVQSTIQKSRAKCCYK